MLVDARARFENYVVGSANRLAVAAAHAVADAPGAVYNPLFIYSGSGLGKTHLIGAIGNLALQRNPDLIVEYVPLEDFVEQLHAAIAGGEMERFKHRYGRVDVLLIDDMQFLTGRRETQSELLRLLNTLQGTGRQIIMTSDRPPVEIADVDERLISRMSGGLIVDIGVPDFETRVAILRAKCEERKVSFAPGVIEELARVDFANVRELQGALNKLGAQQSVDGTITPAQVRGLVGAPDPAPAASPTAAAQDEFFSFLTDIASAVAAHVEPWKVRVGESIAYWGGEGYRTTALERLMAEKSAPANYEALLRGFGQAVEQLRELERQVTTVDPTLGGADLFRDPERLGEAASFVESALAGAVPPAGPQAAFARGAFEESGSNQMAVRAADAVIAEPGHRYNPLFLAGPSGVGKTHLLNAIGNELARRGGPNHRVACVGAQLFIDELIAALQDGTVERFRARYRAADVLLIDDVQFVASKERTQEELFHVFNHFHSAGKQLVFASDLPPKQIEGLEDRLRSRFEGGLVAQLESPDRALRAKLYGRYLSDAQMPSTPELVGFLADRPAASVRELIGTVHRISAAAEARGSALSLDIARAELEAGGITATSAPATVRQAADVFFLDDEKIIWEWPDAGARLVEELR
ncbi:MAG: bacterial DnaA family protein [Gemmatimonadetes bacterium]|jgi:chromosomal replication initiator protein|nr:bacterial DnaA family protein [Gemmatimonadota bacterium]